MIRKDVEHSSVIASAGYSNSLKEMEIEFWSGDIYRYRMIPRWVYEGLLVAPSPGSYFSQNIRDRYFFVEYLDWPIEEDEWIEPLTHSWS